jgi:hypothetical protein
MTVVSYIPVVKLIDSPMSKVKTDETHFNAVLISHEKRSRRAG